jgi:hypothetical protein
MMQRGHSEDPLAGEFERRHLDDDRQRLQDKQTANDGEHDFMLRCHRDGAKGTAQCQ